MKHLTIQRVRKGLTYPEWQQEWADTLISHTPFKAASVTGHGFTHRTAHLPAEWVADYHATANHADSFVVISYDTPIAWVDASGEWVIPAVKYSQSSTRAQRRVMSALDYMRRSYRFDPVSAAQR